MPHVMSNVKTIDELYFRKWTDVMRSGKNVNCDVVRVDNLILVKTKEGLLTTPDIRNFAYTIFDFRNLRPLLKALVMMKVITKKDMNKHLADVKKYQQKSDVRYDAERLAELEKKYGKGLVKVREERDRMRKNKLAQQARARRIKKKMAQETTTTEETKKA